MGASLTLTMFVNALSPHILSVLNLAFRPLVVFFKRRHATSQGELNEAYLGQTFHIETRLAFIVTTVFVSLIFCGGLPILLPFACVTTILCKWVDRYMVCKVCPQPPAYDER